MPMFLLVLSLTLFGKPLALVGGGVALWAVIGLWRRSDSPSSQCHHGCVLLATGVLVGGPVAAIKMVEHRIVLARVPDPLRVSMIEYRSEEDGGGVGLPGDNETGFVVYRLTADSARWARAQGLRLPGKLLPANADLRATPVDGEADHGWRAARGTSRSPPTMATYLNRYGFGIDPHGYDAEANAAIRSPGSFYTYGRGGSITIVDPGRGKVYFAYAG
ncbi:hypothetical protein [Sphingomonas bacterium]|uniref:hypothetical protein n=1 Tax=Sphingomonas bacterium TaxID=1895847 RepID=UPI001575CCCB|nr:hypothetical protein [Sphingomonas bacterium]